MASPVGNSHDHVTAPYGYVEGGGRFDIAINPVTQQPGIAFRVLYLTYNNIAWSKVYYSEFSIITEAWSTPIEVFDTHGCPGPSVDVTQVIPTNSVSLAYKSDGTPAIAYSVSTNDTESWPNTLYCSFVYLVRTSSGWTSTVAVSECYQRHGVLVCRNDCLYENICLRFDRNDVPWVGFVRSAVSETPACSEGEPDYTFSAVPQVWTLNSSQVWVCDWSFPVSTVNQALFHGGISIAMDPNPGTAVTEQPRVVWGHPCHNPMTMNISYTMHYTRRTSSGTWVTDYDIPGGQPSLAFDPVTYMPSVAHSIIGVGGYGDGLYYTHADGQGVLFSETEALHGDSIFVPSTRLCIDCNSHPRVAYEYFSNPGTDQRDINVTAFDQYLNGGAGGWASYKAFDFSGGCKMALDPLSGTPYILSVDGIVGVTIWQQPRIRVNVLDKYTKEPVYAGVCAQVMVSPYATYDNVERLTDIHSYGGPLDPAYEHHYICLIPPRYPPLTYRVFAVADEYETGYVDISLNAVQNQQLELLLEPDGCGSAPVGPRGRSDSNLLEALGPLVLAAVAIALWILSRRRNGIEPNE